MKYSRGNKFSYPAHLLAETHKTDKEKHIMGASSLTFNKEKNTEYQHAVQFVLLWSEAETLLKEKSVFLFVDKSL